jgi:hypothetical protein
VAFVLTGGQVADTSMLTATLEQIYVAGRSGRPRIRPERVIADKGYPQSRVVKRRVVLSMARWGVSLWVKAAELR